MTDITAKLAEALERILDGSICDPNRKGGGSPNRTINTTAENVDTALEALAAYRQHIEAQAGGTEVECGESVFETMQIAFGHKKAPIEDARAALAAAPAAAQELAFPGSPDMRTVAEVDLQIKLDNAHEAGRQQGMSQANAEMAKAEQAVPVAWESIAWLLAEQNGDEPGTLIWEGNPPEPWGEVWCRYEKQARQIAELFPPATERRPLSEAEVDALCTKWLMTGDTDKPFTEGVRAAERAHGITAGTTEQAKEQKT
jgi:hypothetical protein